ncbi:phosphatase PAP2 family protein [Nocardioides pocheonensis]|uniref:Phosphatase PAP2 family protein n=1 Tax=Nocardioides pocheonensis TaxID=661485 RepID=A0A3N0H078_9ACTN|nr:phosphatase PAP2 family protein [Nocardioides pocheonensis]RNM17748.1 phosphatase PAP2 family protein [Nocardioides pocheonensis]
MIRRVNPRVAVVAVLAVASVVTGLLLPSRHGSANPSTADVIAADPPPTLFPVADTARIDRIVARQRPPAAARIQAWVASHGTRPDDRAFVQWVEAGFPPPPANLADQMPQVVALDRQRTSAGVHAATWLETHGKKDVWKLYAHDQREWLTPSAAKSLKADEKALLSMAKNLADTLGTRFGSSAPYVRQPSLRTDHKVTPGQKCPCSYPSRHAAAGAASETLLGGLQPRLDAQYRYLEDEIDYSRVYMAGHFPGDIAGGALLGDLIGDYFLVTREGVDPASLT